MNMYIKFKFTKNLTSAAKTIIHAFLALANAPKTLPHALAPLQTPLPPSERRLPLQTPQEQCPTPLAPLQTSPRPSERPFHKISRHSFF